PSTPLYFRRHCPLDYLLKVHKSIYMEQCASLYFRRHCPLLPLPSWCYSIS
uniref:Uncharacterized protein n=1 Tax=Triticum urartu TaxID=4572 RepID=A0A8R7PT92_TRIUA